MNDRTQHPQVDPDAVGEDRPPAPQPARSVGRWFGFGAATWIVVIGLALIFIIVIIGAAVTQGR